jgi:hypothetical protein
MLETAQQRTTSTSQDCWKLQGVRGHAFYRDVDLSLETPA